MFPRHEKAITLSQTCGKLKILQRGKSASFYYWKNAPWSALFLVRHRRNRVNNHGVSRTSTGGMKESGLKDTSSFDQENIDIVYTWVDGRDPTFQDHLQQCMQAYASSVSPLAISLQRFRDNEELRYSLRSVQAFASWVRKIHIITNGQIPKWLDTTNKRVAIVTHDMIFSDRSYLPTYNSNAIELQLHRIPNLSKRFLYLNDDVFFGREASRADFITISGGEYAYLEPILVSSNIHQGSVLNRSYAYTQNIVDRFWGKKSTRCLPAHIPQLYDREILAHLEDLVAKEFRETSSHRLREPNDLVLRILYFYYLLESNEQAEDGHEARLLQGGSRDYSFLMLENHYLKMWWAFIHILRKRPKFFCINDDLGNLSAGHLIVRSLGMFFRFYFPHPSPFEKKR